MRLCQVRGRSPWGMTRGGGPAPDRGTHRVPAKATHAQTRAHNASLVLRALYDLGPISRADIARLTGLTRTSVGELVADLSARAWPRKSAAARAPAASSRPSSRSSTTPGTSSPWTSASGRSPPRSPTSAARSTGAHPGPRRR